MLNALNTVFHGVVRISSKVNETDVLTRRRRKRTVMTPVRVMTRPNGKCISAGPGVMNKAGRTIRPVKNGSVSQTRLIRKSAGMAESHARKKTRR